MYCQVICFGFWFGINLLTSYQLFQHGHKMEGLRPNASMQEIFRAIIRKYGLKGIFKGMESKILQTVLTSALMFTIYEKIAAFVFRLMRVKRHIKS